MTPEDEDKIKKAMEELLKALYNIDDMDRSLSPATYTPLTLWDRLTMEGRYELISLLHHAEQHDPGYSVIIVPEEGFSDIDETHNMVLDFLHQNNILPLNVPLEITKLEKALHNSV